MAKMQSQECRKRQRCLKKESLHHYIVERIMEKLPVKSLMRFKAVSKQWKSTIESRFFQERQLKNRQQAGDQDVLMVSIKCHDNVGPNMESLRTLVLNSSSSVKISTHWDNSLYSVCQSTCDGLVCLYDHFKSGLVINPTTRWYRRLPLCHFQQLILDLGDSYDKTNHSYFNLGFGKDKFTGIYKPVWLYNSVEISLDQATTCEVFDFGANVWRYVTPAAHRIVAISDPVFVDGSLYWFTECKETKVLSFDLHTEVFQVVSKAPFSANPDHFSIVMCNLDNRLCVSEKKWPTQMIWSFHSSNKTWEKMYLIDLTFRFHTAWYPNRRKTTRHLATGSFGWGEEEKEELIVW